MVNLHKGDVAHSLNVGHDVMFLLTELVQSSSGVYFEDAAYNMFHLYNVRSFRK